MFIYFLERNELLRFSRDWLENVELNNSLLKFQNLSTIAYSYLSIRMGFHSEELRNERQKKTFVSHKLRLFQSDFIFDWLAGRH